MTTTVFLYNSCVLINENVYGLTDLIQNQDVVEHLRNQQLTICVGGDTLEVMFLFGYFCGLTPTKITKYIKNKDE